MERRETTAAWIGRMRQEAAMNDISLRGGPLSWDGPTTFGIPPDAAESLKSLLKSPDAQKLRGEVLNRVISTMEKLGWVMSGKLTPQDISSPAVFMDDKLESERTYLQAMGIRPDVHFSAIVIGNKRDGNPVNSIVVSPRNRGMFDIVPYLDIRLNNSFQGNRDHGYDDSPIVLDYKGQNIPGRPMSMSMFTSESNEEVLIGRISEYREAVMIINARTAEISYVLLPTGWKLAFGSNGMLIEGQSGESDERKTAVTADLAVSEKPTEPTKAVEVAKAVEIAKGDETGQSVVKQERKLPAGFTAEMDELSKRITGDESTTVFSEIMAKVMTFPDSVSEQGVRIKVATFGEQRTFVKVWPKPDSRGMIFTFYGLDINRLRDTVKKTGLDFNKLADCLTGQGNERFVLDVSLKNGRIETYGEVNRVNEGSKKAVDSLPYLGPEMYRDHKERIKAVISAASTFPFFFCQLSAPERQENRTGVSSTQRLIMSGDDVRRR